MEMNKATNLLASCEKYEEDALWFRRIRRNQQQPGEGVHGPQGHGAARLAIREREYFDLIVLGLDALV